MFENTANQLRKDREVLKQLEKGKKLEFIWDYYKSPILAVGFAVVVFLSSFLFNIGRGDTCLYVVLINANTEAETALFDELLERSDIDVGDKTANVITSYSLGQTSGETYDAETIQVLGASFTIGDLDIFGANESVYMLYTQKDAFIDLSLFIENDQLQKHADDLYYSTTEEGETILSGIWMREGSCLWEADYYHEDVLLGVAANAQNLEEAVAVMIQIVEEMP